ncbi:MAG: hypothetical protein R3Y24_04280, partial [Eubacteriales bacterium]
YYFVKCKKCKWDSISTICILSLLGIVINVGLVSAVIFCQTRYTIYNMPLFYMSGLVLLWGIYRYYISTKKEQV